MVNAVDINFINNCRKTWQYFTGSFCTCQLPPAPPPQSEPTTPKRSIKLDLDCMTCHTKNKIQIPYHNLQGPITYVLMDSCGILFLLTGLQTLQII